jgi:xanthine dehydrogenase iron-sulfur cluster and FAD-binding subunit A
VTASSIHDLNSTRITVGAKVTARSIEGTIELAINGFLSGHRRMRVLEGSASENIVVPLNESQFISCSKHL